MAADLRGIKAGFLPVNREEMRAKGWDAPDFVYVTGDAYVDHPSFGLAIISRTLEQAGYRVCMLPQPDWHNKEAFMEFGKPRIGFLVTAGVVDSMVNNYTAAKKKRNDDVYSPGGIGGKRPDRATVVYCNRIREAYGNIFIGIGGVEASLRRFAHYDYWDNKVRNSMLVDSGADVLMFGMGERTILEVAEYAKNRGDFSQYSLPGVCVSMKEPPENAVVMKSCEEAAADKKAYCEAFMVQYENQDPVRGKILAQKHGRRYVVQTKPTMPLTTEELDKTYGLNYVRKAHPMYDEYGGIPALKEVEFSITSERGCFGSCNFCALTFHQGRIVTSRSKESIIKEATMLTKQPGFKGYIHDVGGPTANFRHPACAKQLKAGTCKSRECLFPHPCPNVDADHSDYIEILEALRKLPKVKKVFVRSGIRFDYMLLDKKHSLLDQLVQHHISGQLKVAPEHISPKVLSYMGKPTIDVFDRFRSEYEAANKKYGKQQYIVPYFMSSHPGCNLDDAIMLAQYMQRTHLHPEQVQDFYPTPGTMSTCMFYTEIDPRTMKHVYVAKTPEDKAMQRALMQYNRPENRETVIKALRKAGRSDLVGNGPHCLVSEFGSQRINAYKGKKNTPDNRIQEKSGISKNSRGKNTERKNESQMKGRGRR